MDGFGSLSNALAVSRGALSSKRALELKSSSRGRECSRFGVAMDSASRNWTPWQGFLDCRSFLRLPLVSE